MVLKWHRWGWRRRREAVRGGRDERRMRDTAGDSIVGVSGIPIGAVFEFTTVA